MEFSVHICEYNRSNADYETIYRPEGSGDYLFLLFKTPMKVYDRTAFFIAQENACLFYTPDHEQHYQAVQKFRNSYVHFWCGENLGETYGIPQNAVFYPQNTEAIDELIRLLQREYIVKDPYAVEYEEALVRQMMITASRGMRLYQKAAEEPAGLYQEFLEHNISVVAANKAAASSDYATYQKLKSTARKRGVKFLFETNVGAGLPIIRTMNDLLNSGDKILKIEAVLSGTLNFIFNKISADVPFSETVRLAKEEGYSEPDPRVDLSGKDVIRKLVILAREAGYRIEQSDVEKHLFVPDSFFRGTLDEFWKNLPSLDADFERRRKVLESEGKRWRFVSRYENGKASVELCEVGREHPFYTLEGSNNIILLTTERYKEYPMQIQGYGAGAGVTAAGVFADIMSIANV